MLYQLVLFILIGCAWDIQAQRGGCPQYEEWSWCPPACHGDGCTPTNHVTRCIQACDQQPRCVCRRGYFRQNGVCVRKRQCQMFSNTYFEQFQREFYRLVLLRHCISTTASHTSVLKIHFFKFFRLKMRSATTSLSR